MYVRTPRFARRPPARPVRQDRTNVFGLWCARSPGPEGTPRVSASLLDRSVRQPFKLSGLAHVGLTCSPFRQSSMQSPMGYPPFDSMLALAVIPSSDIPGCAPASPRGCGHVSRPGQQPQGILYPLKVNSKPDIGALASPRAARRTGTFASGRSRNSKLRHYPRAGSLVIDGLFL